MCARWGVGVRTCVGELSQTLVDRVTVRVTDRIPIYELFVDDLFSLGFLDSCCTLNPTNIQEFEQSWISVKDSIP